MPLTLCRFFIYFDTSLISFLYLTLRLPLNIISCTVLFSWYIYVEQTELMNRNLINGKVFRKFIVRER